MERLKKRTFLSKLVHRLYILPGILFLTVMLVPSLCMAQEQIERHVYDNAGYFSMAEAEELESLCLKYGEASDSNIILLIENGVENGGWKTFMEDFYDANEDVLGNAAMLLLDVNEEERRIEMQGYGEMEYYISDSRIEDMIDGMIDDLKAGEYYTALASFPVMVKDYYDHGYAEDARTHTETDNENYDPYYYEKEAGILETCLLALPVALIIGAAGTAVMVYQSGGKDTTTFRSYMDEDRRNLIGRYDRYTHTTTSRRRKPQEHDNSGGGGGGVSSGGNSHSGGGRSF